MASLRKSRCFEQKIFLIETLPITDEFERSYIIMGSTGNIYTVKINSQPSCNCPDFLTRNNRCKHIYFILLRIMRIKNPDIPTYSNLELIDMFLNIPDIVNTLLAKPEIKNKYTELKSSPINPKQKTDDLCPICLDDLVNGEELDFCKYSCGKSVHKNCFKIWSKIKPVPICVFCQKNWEKIKYLNLT